MYMCDAPKLDLSIQLIINTFIMSIFKGVDSSPSPFYMYLLYVYPSMM